MSVDRERQVRRMHLALIRALNADDARGQPDEYLLMEFVAGRPLAEAIRRHHPGAGGAVNVDRMRRRAHAAAGRDCPNCFGLGYFTSLVQLGRVPCLVCEGAGRLPHDAIAVHGGRVVYERP